MIGFTGPLKRRIRELESQLAQCVLEQAQLLCHVAKADAHLSSLETSRRLRVNDLQDIKDHVQQCLMGAMHMVEGPGLTDYRKILEALESTVSKKIALQKGIIVEPASSADTRKMAAMLNEEAKK